MVDPDDLRDAFARLPAGVDILSTRHAAGFRGLTATTFTPVSLDPPLVLVCIDALSATGDAIASHGAFNVSILGRGHQFLADRFAGQAPAADPAWTGVPHRLGDNGLPVIEGAAGWLACNVHAIQPVGDHRVVVGEVTGAGRGGGDPLVHWERSYWSLNR